MHPNSEDTFPNYLQQPLKQRLSVQGNRPLADRRLFSILAAALGQKDPYTQLHARRVSVYAGQLAHGMGLPNTEIDQIVLGGMLHDVGKLALSDMLFSHRQAKLTTEMWGQVYSHPLIGAGFLELTCGKGAIHDAALFHHERLDGSGYPFGLLGDRIPLCAQIVSVADCFDAITTDRPYQKRKSHHQAFTILNSMAGLDLNADLVAVFIDLFGQSRAIRHTGKETFNSTSMVW